MDRKGHWEDVYAQKAPTEVSWYQPEPRLSLELIHTSGIGHEGRIIDVGGGASTLVDALIASGFRHVAVLDISSTALAKARERLGTRRNQVHWIEADITQVRLAEPYDLWHDRAVFHFLTDPQDRRKYIDSLKHCLKIGGHLIIAAFALDGPQRCSGLDVVRYSPDTLAQEFGAAFTQIDIRRETHLTPWGKPQEFVYCHLRRQALERSAKMP